MAIFLVYRQDLKIVILSIVFDLLLCFLGDKFHDLAISALHLLLHRKEDDHTPLLSTTLFLLFSHTVSWRWWMCYPVNFLSGIPGRILYLTLSLMCPLLWSPGNTLKFLFPTALYLPQNLLSQQSLYDAHKFCLIHSPNSFLYHLEATIKFSVSKQVSKHIYNTWVYFMFSVLLHFNPPFCVGLV